jgi:formate dehydrogenase subunit gamma
LKPRSLPGRAFVRACLVAIALSATGAARAPENQDSPMDAPQRRAVLLVAPSSGYRQPPGPLTFGENETVRCLGCHGMMDFVVRDSASGQVLRRSVDRTAFSRSAHRALACTQCHPNVRGFPHAFGGVPRPRVGCDAECHARDAKGLPVRHSKEMGEFREGAHRKGLDGDPDSPTCTYCHGGGDPHAVAGVKEGFTREGRLERCASCHENRERMLRAKQEPEFVSSYRRGFHYKALRLGEPRAAICQDCHGTHAVRASRDTAATTNVAHLERTCGQKGCHPGAGARLAGSGTDHLAMRSRHAAPANQAGALLAWVGGAVLLLMAASVLLDLQRPLRGRPGRPAEGSLVPRLSGTMRLQHGALVGSFTLLALTGLPLRYPDAPVLRAVHAALGGWEGARAVHRASGALLLAVALVHLLLAIVWLVRARLDSARAWPMLPGGEDVREAWETLLYQLRLRRHPPEHGRHEFRARVHYLAVLWGVPVMALTGLALWLPWPLAERLPRPALALAAVVHGEEALIAVAVVLLWHFYNVHFAPGRDLRAWTFVDGRVTDRHAAVVHPRTDGDTTER